MNSIDRSEGSPGISASNPDWGRETPRKIWDPSRRLLQSIRGYQGHKKPGFYHFFLRRWWILSHWFWSLVTQAEIDLNCEIAGGLMIPHPNGIVIHPEVLIGPNCFILHQVTLGTRIKPGVPKVGGAVFIGAGAKVLGNVALGDHCKIGANSVVVDDVPPGAVAIGNPATIR